MMPADYRNANVQRCWKRCPIVLVLLALSGCWAPLHSPAIPASSLPDSFRAPTKALSGHLNYALLTRDAPSVYALGPDDLIRVEIYDLVPQAGIVPPRNGGGAVGQGPFSHVVEARVDERGEIMLPLVGAVRVGQLTLDQARQQVVQAYAQGFLDNPRASVSLVQKSTTRVIVLGAVQNPAVYELPKYENDIAHALAMAGGVIPEMADEIQVHRKVDFEVLDQGGAPVAPEQGPLVHQQQLQMLRIPLRSNVPVPIGPEEVTLTDGDAVVVRSGPEEVFYVVGKLSPNNFVRFTLGRENRDLGNGFVLPDDRDIDVVTAVAMAGYIDPIDSPTTVTVHRSQPDGTPLLIHVDLIAARYDRKENILVKPGDIIYLNPDAAWWFRRTFDRVVPTFFTSPYVEAMERWINPRGFND